MSQDSSTQEYVEDLVSLHPKLRGLDFSFTGESILGLLFCTQIRTLEMLDRIRAHKIT